MNDTIVTREYTRSKARRDFFAGLTRDDHNMNPSCEAVTVYQAEFDRLDTERRNDLALESRRATRLAKSLPQLHAAPAGVLRVDARQVGV